MRRWYVFLMATGIFLAAAAMQSVHSAWADTKVSPGREVAFNYTLTVDGQVIDNSKERGPFRYIHGQATIIPGLARQLEGLHVGDKKSITVSAKEGYGEVNPNGFKEVARSSLPKNIEPKAGMFLEAKDEQGRILRMKIKEVKKDTVVLDLNHPLAGKTLNFKIEIVSIK